jgi:hypothetical protein
MQLSLRSLPVRAIATKVPDWQAAQAGGATEVGGGSFFSHDQHVKLP